VNRTVLPALVAIVLAFAGTATLLGLAFMAPGPEAALPVVIGERPYATNALVYIAEERGFFRENGLCVTRQAYPSVVDACDGLASGEVDLALPSEYIVAGSVLKGHNLTVFGSIDRFEALFLVARADRGIADLADLRGRRIGLTRGASGEFHLDRFLDRHGVDGDDVELVPVPPGEQIAALANGSVDAIVAAELVDPLRARYGSDLLVWSVQNDQPGQIVVAARCDWAAAHPEEARRFLAALAEAEQFVIERPHEAKTIVGHRLNRTDAAVEEVWGLHRYELSLDRSLVSAMTDEARWMIANDLTNATEVPDFTAFVDPAPLSKVDPDAVGIIGNRT
jgi:NitT/TauT family transport system substrate-binding protein